MRWRGSRSIAACDPSPPLGGGEGRGEEGAWRGETPRTMVRCTAQSRVGQHGGMSQETTREQGPAMQDETQKTEATTANPAFGRSTVAKLPPELREAVDKAIAEGATIDEITARIREERRKLLPLGRRPLRQGRARADPEAAGGRPRTVKAWMQEFGDHPQGELALVFIEGLRAMAIDTMRASRQAEGARRRSEELSRSLSLALKRIESTDMSSASSASRRRRRRPRRRSPSPSFGRGSRRRPWP